MKILDAKAAVDKESEKLEKLPSKMEVILEALKEQITVLFASLMDTCHPKNAESEPNYQKYRRPGSAPR